MLLHETKRKAGRMWSKSCSSFPPDTYVCHTYPQEVNHRGVCVFSGVPTCFCLLIFQSVDLINPKASSFCLGTIMLLPCVANPVHLVYYWWTYVPSLSADIVDGNLKSIMRIILALAAHFKPTANHRAASANGRGLTRGSASHNPLSTVALAQGAVAALASARLDASQPARTTRIHRYGGRNYVSIIL